ncbi:hypothetical protein Tco_0521529, partial [Tanacetum coccineum]
MTPAAIEEMINQCVDAALDARRVNRDLGPGNGNDYGGGDGNGNDIENGNNRGENGAIMRTIMGMDKAIGLVLVN